MRNPVKRNANEAIAQAAALAQGAEQHAATVDLGFNNAANIRLDARELTNAVAALNDSKDELLTRRRALHQLSRTTRRFLMAARDTFKPTLGFTYNPAWDTVGMVGSLYIPEAPEKILPILAALRAYLSLRPELHDEDEGLTPALLQERYDALDDAIGAVNTQVSAARNLLQVRNRKLTALKRRIRGTISALEQLFDPLDTRWASYGLNQPGLKARPEKPEGLSVALAGPNARSVKWQRSAGADYYRVRLKRLGVDADWVLIGSPADLDFLLEGLPSSGTAELVITAVNNGGESPYSDVLSFPLG